MLGLGSRLRHLPAFIAGLIVVGIAAAAVGIARSPGAGVVLPDPISRDFEAIMARDTLTVLTSYNSTSYFLYRGEPMGYEYELLKDFAEESGIVFRIRVVPRDSLLYYLNAGEGDVAAARLVTAREDTLQVSYTAPLYETQAVIVQQTAPFDSLADPIAAAAVAGETPADIARMRRGPQVPLSVRARTIQAPRELAGERVFVPEGDPFADRLVELEDDITGDIKVVEVDTTSESLIRQVARGNIALTVAQENVADLEAGYFSNLAVTPAIGAPSGIGWAVRTNAPELRRALNAWIQENRSSGRWAALYRRYFVDSYGYRERIETGYLTAETGTLSDYDALLKQAAPTIGWDWRLLASQMFQESRFDPQARSWAGAQGLLQIMPATARELGVADPFDPRANIAGAVKYLDWLDVNYWRDAIPDSTERVRFVLASYNVGAGHVMDAQRLATAAGGDATHWPDVAYWLLQKSRTEVYTRPEVRHGYCRGLEPVQYVQRILDRYATYAQFVRDA